MKYRKVIEQFAQRYSHNEDDEVLPCIEELLIKEERVAFVHHVISELPQRCRDHFIRHKIHHMSYADIARHQRISESGVEKHIMKGLRHCRQRFQQLSDAR